MWLPARILGPLLNARDFAEYQKSRRLRFLHMFSGETDVLGDAIKEAAKKEGLIVENYSLDKLGEGDVDLTRMEPSMSLKEEASKDAFDAAHAGFPCNTFLGQDGMEHGASGPTTCEVFIQLGGRATAGRCGHLVGHKID